MLFILLIATLAISGGQGQEIPLLTSKTGKVYEKARVMAVEATGLKIIHAAGVARIAFEDLSEELQKQYHYNPDAAAKARLDEQRKQLDLRLAQAQDETLEASRLSMMGTIYQVTGNGILLSNVVYNTGKKEEVEKAYTVTSGGPNALNPNASVVSETRTRKEWELVTRKLDPDALLFVECRNEELVNGEEWSAPVYPFGTFSYTKPSGFRETVRAYTTSGAKYLQRLEKQAVPVDELSGR